MAGETPALPGSLPVVHLLQQLIDRQQPFGAIGVAAEDGVVPALHPDRTVEIVADAELAAGNELEEDLLVRGAGQAAIRERDVVGLPAAVGGAAAFAIGRLRRQQRGGAAI